MPHFKLMNEDALGPVEGPLLRSRLHIRAARRRFELGKIDYGIVTLFDALHSALEWYVAKDDTRGGLDVREGEDLRDPHTVCRVLIRSGILDESFDYESIDRIVDGIQGKNLEGFDYQALTKDIESVMLKLGVMPFEESKLPPEDPSVL